MTQFESAIKATPYPAKPVFDFLSDFNNFESFIPHDKISDWSCTGDSCNFKVNGIGNISLKIIDKEFPKTIKYGSDSDTAIDFFFWVQLKEINEKDTRVKLTLKAELNPMMKMVASDPINRFLNILADAIVNHNYSV